jgi:hypothetical protein
VCNKLMNFFKADTGGDPARTAIGYRLDGAPMDRTSGWTPKGMIGPQLCGAMVDAHQDYLNALWSYNATTSRPLLRRRTAAAADDRGLRQLVAAVRH